MPELETVRFDVTGMTCASCANRIARSIKKVDGVSRVTVDLRRETATVTRRRDLVPDAALGAAVEAAGYGADFSSAVIGPAEAGRGILERLLRRSR